MDNRYSTLHSIYEMVKMETDPTAVILQTAEIIMRQSLPWSEVGQHLNQLKEDGFIELRQFNTAVVYLTAKGLHYCLAEQVEQAA
jgi:hypothetical protein